MCALCSHTQNMPHAMKSGERHEVCGVRDSVSKLAGADHHGRSMSPRGTPATQTTAATTASNGTQARHQSQVKVNVAKCRACHAKWRWMSPSATSATQTAAATTASNGTQARHQSQRSAVSARPARQDEGQCRQVPRLPRKVKVDVAKRDACHAKWRWMSPSATPATQTAAATTALSGTQPRHQSQPSAISATPATQSGMWASCVWVSCVCVWELCVSKLCVSKLRRDGGRRRRSGRECTAKTKNPTQRCGEKLFFFFYEY